MAAVTLDIGENPSLPSPIWLIEDLSPCTWYPAALGRVAGGVVTWPLLPGSGNGSSVFTFWLLSIGAGRDEELPESVSPSQAAGQINMEDEQKQEEPLLSEQLGRLCAMEEMDVLASEDWAEEQEPRQPARTEQQKPHQDTAVAEDRPRGSQTTRKTAKQKMIDLQAVLAGESCMIHCPTLPVAVQDEVSKAGDWLQSY